MLPVKPGMTTSVPGLLNLEKLFQIYLVSIGLANYTQTVDVIKVYICVQIIPS